MHSIPSPVWSHISDKAVGLLLHRTQNDKSDIRLLPVLFKVRIRVFMTDFIENPQKDNFHKFALLIDVLSDSDILISKGIGGLRK